MSKIYVILGYPGSGKSTLVADLFKVPRPDTIVRLHGDNMFGKDVKLVFAHHLRSASVIIYERCTITKDLLNFLVDVADVEVLELNTGRGTSVRRWEKREQRAMWWECRELFNRYERELNGIRKLVKVKKIGPRWVPAELVVKRGLRGLLIDIFGRK